MMVWSTTDFGGGYSADTGGTEAKKSWCGRHGLKVLGVLVGATVFLVTVLAGMWYMHTLTEQDMRDEIRKAIQEARSPKHEARRIEGGQREEPVGIPTGWRNGAGIRDKAKMPSLSTTNTRLTPMKRRSSETTTTSNSAAKVLLASRKPWLNLRLPSNVVPQAYVINLDVDMHNDVYKGNVTINVFVTKETNVILLHNMGPKIDDVRIVENKTNEITKILYKFPYLPNEFLVLKLDRFLKSNSTHVITLWFHAAMHSTDLSGFYVSYYNNGDGKKKVASTFFSPLSARTAFPCFDEPNFKALFTVHLTHSSSYKAYSNMVPYSTCERQNKTTTEFRTTLKMSTYYLCWVIGDYKMIQHKNNGEKWDIRGLTYGSKTEDIEFGLNTGYKLLNFYEEYFGIPYPLTKLDLLAVPSFGPGAMENWGIITFRGERILNNRNTTTQEERQKSFNLLAHELTHQWFGNLVTMEFWTDAWLKEGFANNIGTIGGHHVDPEMGSKEHVLTDWMLPTMEIDSYSTSHPVSHKLKNSIDIRSIFDLITYNKGSCLVGLLHSFVGDEHFKQGLHRYLSKYAYGNAKQDDLWAAMSWVSGKNVKEVMDTWTLQLGYPVVSVARINGSFVRVQQERYSLDGPGVSPPRSPFGYVWKIPLIFKSHADGSDMMHLLEEKSGVFRVPEKFTILNPDHAMFYRVNYGSKMLANLKTLLKNDRDALSAQDRTGLVADQFSFISTNRSDVGATMDMFSYLKSETDFYPWKIALEKISFLEMLIESEEDALKFNKYVQSLIADTVKKMGWKKLKTINNGSLQALLLNKACHSDESEVFIQARTYFEAWVVDPDKHLDLRPTLVRTMRDCAIAFGEYWYWEYLFLRYKRSSGNSHDALLWSLTSTTHLEIVKKMLAYSIDSEKIDSQYTVYVIIELSKNSNAARDLCWSFIKENWELIFKRYGHDIFMLSDMLSAVLPRFSSDEDLRDIENFFRGRDLGSAKNAYNSSVFKIKSNIEWKRKHFHGFKDWLDRLDVSNRG